MFNSSYSVSIFYLLITILISACGGGPSSSSNQNQINSNNNQQPHELSTENMTGVNLLSREATSSPTVSSNETSITITYSTSNPTANDHYQFFINVDNDVTTGFQFNNEAWDQSGADYLVEDGDLFKSTANDDTWSWNTNIGSILSTTTDSSISVTIEKALLQNLVSKIRIGFMSRDSKWDVLSFYPQASQMESFAIDTPPSSTDIVPPELRLNGSDAMRIVKDSIFHDPSVFAYDEVDGDISHRAVTVTPPLLPDNTITSNVGTKKITYTVADNAGNETTIVRAISVVDSQSEEIVIDGNIDDWNSIPEVVSNSTGSIKVNNNYGYLNILIQAPDLGENTQILIDVDNNSNTGMQFFGGDWDFGGADYMIENRDLSKSRNPFAWSWDYQVAPIDYIKKGNIIEIGILKSNLENLSQSINVGFVNRDSNWSIKNEILPATGMTNYVLSQPTIQIPTDAREKLCSNPNQPLFREFNENFEDGLIYNGKRYFIESLNNAGLNYKVIKVQNPDGSNTQELITFESQGNEDDNPKLYSLSGALFFTALGDGVHPRSRTSIYRIFDDNSVERLFIRKGDLQGEVALIGDMYYLSSFNKDSSGGFSSLSSYSVNNSNASLNWLFIMRTGRGLGIEEAEHVLSIYQNGQLFYAYTVGQLANTDGTNGVPSGFTHVGDRILGVINDSTGLKPVSVCK